MVAERKVRRLVHKMAASGATAASACGLANLGNSCYLNALLQCLASLPQFRDDLLASSGQPRSYTCALRECLWEMRSGTSATVQANRALWRQLQRGGLIDGTLKDDFGAQQDADEMLGALCDALVTERAAASSLGAHDGAVGLAAIITGVQKARSRPTSPAAVERMRCMLASGYTCTVCGWKSDVSCAPSWNIPLSWQDTPPGQPVRLLDLFGHFFAAERVDGVYCPGCSGALGLDAADRAVADGPGSAPGAAVQLGRGGRTAEMEWRARVECGRERLFRWRQHVNAGDPLTPMPWPPWPTASDSSDSGGDTVGLEEPAAPLEPRQHVTVKKWMSLCRLPDCLCLFLKRLQYDKHSGQFFKDSRPVDYPFQLDLSPFLSLAEVSLARQKASRQADSTSVCIDREHDVGGVYELCGVVMHHGGANGGHYTSYMRLPRSGVESDDGSSGEKLWAHADDESVRVGVPEEWVAGKASQEAYMLFYTRTWNTSQKPECI